MALVVTLCFVFLLEAIHAFETRHCFLQQSRPTTTPNYAVIYGEDGTIEDDSFGSFSSDPSPLMESLSNKIDMSSLLRIGCAFAPPPHNNLHPKDAISAQLVNLDATHLDIAIAVSTVDGSGCVQVLVPVAFPTSCHDGSSSNTEACILENLQQLDAQAHSTIANREWKNDYADELAEKQQIIQTLKEQPAGYDLPNWWTYPELNFLLDEECTLMKDLLNEDDFSHDMAVLFQKGLRDSGESVRVAQACVASVGPSGLFLRAQVYDEEDRYFTKDLGIQFKDEAKSADALRSSILGLVDSAGEEEPMDAQTISDEVVSQEKVSPYDLEAIEEKKMEEAFQRTLLEARIQYDLSAMSRESPVGTQTQYKKEDPEEASKDEASRQAQNKLSEAFQRTLLRARLKNDLAVWLQLQAKKKEALQRELLEARLKYQTNTVEPMLYHSGPYAGIIQARRQQPKLPNEEAELSKKYSEIKDIGERAHAILKDLEMI